MPPILASVVCFLVIVYLLRFDGGRPDGVSNAVWIPFFWIFFGGSRFLSQWLDLGTNAGSAQDYSDGSPIDGVVFLALFLSGVWVLLGRRLKWGSLLRRNAWIFLFFAFAAMSIFWADEPVVSLKRWVKGFGNLVMALVILTEGRPFDALGIVLKRLSFILIPLSILFVRFYPDLGRSYHMGVQMYNGVAFHKNSLGQLCLIFGMYFCWDLLLKRSNPGESSPSRWSIYAIMLLSIAWLLYVADSATSTTLMVMSICFLLCARVPAIAKRPQRMLAIGIVAVALAVWLDSLLGIKGKLIELLGREPDLTSRTPVWDMLLTNDSHPWFGAGYEGFWTGQRMTDIWSQMGFDSGGIIQAHNGYIDIYLNLGAVGLALLLGAIVFGSVKAIRQLEADYATGAFRVLIVVVVVIYNYTEAAFKPLSSLFVLLLFALTEINGAVLTDLAKSTRKRTESFVQPAPRR